MWCSRCEQDVPGLASPGKMGFVCVRCGEKLENPQKIPEFHGNPGSSTGEGMVCPSIHTPTLPHPSGGISQPVYPPYEGVVLPISSFLGYDDWEIDQALRRIGRQVGKDLPGGLHSHEQRRSRLDASHEEIPQSHWALSKQPILSQGRMRHKNRTGILLYGGLMTLVCGTVLLVWSYLSGREELQLWGWPCLIVGQAGLLLGVFFHAPSEEGAKIPKESPSSQATPPQEGSSSGNPSSAAWREQAHPFPPRPIAPFHSPSYQTG